VNLQEYIESGVLELYAMGALPPEEADRVARDVAAHPELHAELRQISATLETIAPFGARVAPSSSLRGRVLDAIEAGERKREEGGGAPIAPAERRDARVIPMEAPAAPPRRSWLMAASFIGLLLTGAAAFWLWTRAEDLEKKLATLQEDQKQIAGSLQQAHEELQAFRDHDNRVVRMNSTGDAPSMAVVYWNPDQQTVWIDAATMPPLPEGKQYQLWAIADGDPVDAGVFDGQRPGLQKLKNVSAAKVFAVTVEKKGGSPSPTMETMAVKGELSEL
jgi:anti-sigma-K factor RskA